MKYALIISFLLTQATMSMAAHQSANDFRVKAFHIDLRIQVMKMPALMQLARHLHEQGINTIIMEWEGSYPYNKESVISNELAYTRSEVKNFIDYCSKLGIDVIPLQQTFGHVEYILRHYRYAELREDPKDFSQVCPSELAKDSVLFTNLIKDMISLHQSAYVHIGGDETFLLGHCPKCQKKVAEEGLSKLYFDYLKMICDVVVGLGKKPVLWADIALKYPEYIQLLPKGTVFVDWNYGWSLDRFGDHKKLLASGYEVWGAAAIRSDPDNFYLEKWKKHFDNISTFIPQTRNMHYAGMVMTSWSTSGAYSTVFDAHEDPLLLYPVRRVYPLSGFYLLIDAYAAAIKSDSPLDAHEFITTYCRDHYGLGQSDAAQFESALFLAPYSVISGNVKEKVNCDLSQLIDSASQSLQWLQTLAPSKNKMEFAHYILMAEIRLFYLQVLQIEAEMNTDEYTVASHEKFHTRLLQLKDKSQCLNQKFADLNKDFLYQSEISKENDQRNYKLDELLGKTSTPSRDPVVKTSQGYIKGLTENGIAVFKGIPYAQPPVDNYRFMPPMAHTPWTDTLNTVQFGSSAMQPSGPGAAGSEDCLYLNLYTPKIDAGKRAVVVWVHGGSMTNGSGKGMNGHAFADKDDIVTITINYRLGALGFLDMADLSKKYAQSGNLGLLDVIAALKWVHENIAAFGGDPDRVTIMGESAGAKLLSAMMVSTASKGLYKQAILESGSVQCIRDSLTAKNARTLLLKQLGLHPDDAGRLLTMSADSIIKAQAAVCDGLSGNSFFGPVYDGITIRTDGYEYAREGKLSGIKAIIGTNENEGAAFIFKTWNASDPNTTVFRPLFRSNAPMAAAYYQTRLKTDSPYAAMIATLTQYMYQLHSYRFAKALTGAGTPVWMYRYKFQNGRQFGARHGDELHYIWDAAEIVNSTDDTAKRQLALSLHSAWVSFIKTGDPNGDSIPKWPPYSDKNRQIILFDNIDTVVTLKEVYNDPTFPSPVFILR